MSLRKLIILSLFGAFLIPGAGVLWAQDAEEGEGFSLLDDVSATQVFGPDVTADDVRNKVVLFMYWRGEGSISKPTMLRLRGLQKKYFPSGRFMALSSEVRGNRGETKEVCRQYSINFPVFSELRLSQATYAETPYAVLFDHEGNIVSEGDPNTVFLKIADAVEDAPAPVSPMLEGVEITDDGLERRAVDEGEGLLLVVSRSARPCVCWNAPPPARVRAMLKLPLKPKRWWIQSTHGSMTRYPRRRNSRQIAPPTPWSCLRT